MFDSLKLNDLYQYAMDMTVIATILFIVMLFVQRSYIKKKNTKSATEALKTENTEIEVISHKRDNEKILHISSILLRTACALTIITAIALIFYASVINKMALANGAYNNIQNTQTIGEIKECVKYGFEESEDIPSDLTGCIVVFYKYDCPDCKAIHNDLVKAIDAHKDNEIYFVSVHSATGSRLLHPGGDTDKSLVDEVPSAVYYKTYNDTDPDVKKTIIYTFDENKNPKFDAEIFEILLKYQDDASKITE